MSSYLNPGNKGFRESLNSEIYVDKTGLIDKTNAVLNTRQKFLCVSRPRRFGKSMAADMLAAYYERGEDSSELFDSLKISQSASYQTHRNQYDVLKVNMQEFLSMTHSMDEMLAMLQKYVIFDLKDHFDNVRFRDEDNLIQVMKDIYSKTRCSFVILIDEWDCLFREYQQDYNAQKKYLDFLRVWLKDKDYVALAYMTGILPIKKYGSHSALNMFTEYSMTDPGELAEYFGFTEKETLDLCEKYGMSFEEAETWYDGYHLIMHRQTGNESYSIYNPKSVVEAMMRHKFGTYWNQTETYEALKIYIQMNMDGLKDSVIRMLAGEAVSVNVGTFSNDMTTFATKDDVLTLLVHLGYLTYDSINETVKIPNKEVSQEYVNAISTMNWYGVAESVESSRRLLEALWSLDEEAVASGIEKAHEEVSILQYNDENSLSCTINLAFYFAREFYTIVREMPSGRGFADVCMIPRKKHLDKPAVVIELKWDKSVSGALDQIKEKNYGNVLKEYRGKILLVGINYNKKTKKHECAIEVLEK
ncbi:AAA family ATPase [Blautia sp. MSJ-19]|uniref:AAA family ATPase n=1 Tax=Blautia sp. MSJ-19 TaxID=2841517 RepID=UPI001C0F2690|nr:AAA family ATPase [Blautia sp. MSJ-19]MBU5480686.1 ATP-binding protein [Blautia sp. MSJ-19]